ncbi:MAG: S46 family peptidase [Chitinophagales bacterium]
MTKRNFLIAGLSALLLWATPVQKAHASIVPDEGMWLANLARQLNWQYLKQIGLKLTADEIYSTTSPSLKDAVVQLGEGDGGFCTAEFVSESGLLFTNHHCGFESVAAMSTPEHNYIDDGFWAYSRDQELPIPGLWIRILQDVIDVTDSIVPYMQGLEPMARRGKLMEIESRLTAKYEEMGYIAEVESMYYGNQYFLYLYRQYNDVRLTGVPPSSIGNYGGDTDNWMWPRHTGDFSIFRVYADKNNEPAEYSADNVPYAPKKFLTISLNGYKEGDFTMIMGFPGSTNRYLTSYGMKEVMTESNPAQIDCFKTVTDVMKKDMDKDEAVRIQLAPNYAQLMNGLKLYKTQLDGMRRMDAVGIKEQQEKEFMQWAKQQGATQEQKYKDMFEQFAQAYASMSAVNKEFYYKIYSVVLMPTGSFALDFSDVESLIGKDAVTGEDAEAIKEGIREASKEMWDGMHYETEVKKLSALLNMLYTKLPSEKYPQVLTDILSNTKGATPQEKFDTWSAMAISKSVYTTPEKLEAFLNAPNPKKLSKDALYNFYIGLFTDAQTVGATWRSARTSINMLEKDYVSAIMKKDADKHFYPDANFTMRLTYGTVEDYEARDAVHYHWQTTIDGVMEKRNNDDPEFIVPDKLYQLHKAEKITGAMPRTGPFRFVSFPIWISPAGTAEVRIMNGNGQS